MIKERYFLVLRPRQYTYIRPYFTLIAFARRIYASIALKGLFMLYPEKLIIFNT